MEDWLKILITALASFSVAILSEPLKAYLSNGVKARRLRRSLYIELGALFYQLYQIWESTDLTIDRARRTKNELSIKVYEAAMSDPTVFHQLADFPRIEQAYHLVQRIKAAGDVSHDAVTQCERCLRYMAGSIPLGFDFAYMQQVATEDSRRTIADVQQTVIDAFTLERSTRLLPSDEE